MTQMTDSDKMKELLKFKPEKVFRARKVFTRIGLQAKQKNQHETAIQVLNIAESVTKKPDDKVPLCVAKSQSYRALADMDDARYEALRALAFDSTAGVVPYLNMAHLLYHENEFEDAIIKFIKGLDSTNPQFQEGADLVLGTLMKSVGSDAGSMFDRHILGDAIIKMKQEMMGIAPEPKILTYTEELIRNQNLEKTKRYLTGRYLGKVAKEKRYFNELNNTELHLGIAETEDKVQAIIEDTLEKIQLKEVAMWRRQPLYYFYNKVRAFTESAPAKKMEKEKKRLQRVTIECTTLKKIKDIVYLKQKEILQECYQRILRLRTDLESITKTQLPIKAECSRTLYEIAGDMYLSRKRMCAKVSQQVNDLRIKYALGVYRDWWPTVIGEVIHIKVRNRKKLIKRFIDELERTDDENEKAFLYNELACLVGEEAQSGGKIRRYAFNVLIAAKKINSLVWYLNSLFLIAKSALTDDKMEEGILTLVAAEIACRKYGKLEEAKFIERAILLLQYIKPEDFLAKKNILDKSKQLIELMPTSEQKDKAAALLITLNEIPLWRRMSLPGSGTYKQRLKALQKLRPYPVNKLPEHELLPPHKDKWICGYDDYAPYHVLDKVTQTEKNKRFEKVYKESKYAQFLTIEGKARDYRAKRRRQN